MQKKDVIAFFGTPTKTARCMRISHQAVYAWPDKLPDSVQFKVELVTKGALKSDETLLMESLHNEQNN